MSSFVKYNRLTPLLSFICHCVLKVGSHLFSLNFGGSLFNKTIVEETFCEIINLSDVILNGTHTPFKLYL